jgi:hypothetical protein
MAKARLASKRTTLPRGTGLRRSFAKAMPSARKSSAYLDRPVTLARRSFGAWSVPINLNWVSWAIWLCLPGGVLPKRVARIGSWVHAVGHAVARLNSTARCADVRILS